MPFTDAPRNSGARSANARHGQDGALRRGLQGAQERLRAGSRDKKVLIVISDGGDNASAHKLAEVLKTGRAIQRRRVHHRHLRSRRCGPAIRACSAVWPGQPAAKLFSRSSSSEVVAICERIARDIRHQYTIGYVSSSTAPAGAYRTIRVVARATGRGKLFVRTRSGYIAGGESRPPEQEAAK